MTKAEALAQMSCPLGGRAVQLEHLLHEILAAGFAGANANPYFALFDADDRPWPIVPRDMSAIEIIDYVDRCFGREVAVHFSRMPQLITH